MDGYKNLVILLLCFFLNIVVGCDSNPGTEYYLKFKEGDTILEMPKVILLNGREIGKVENIEINESFPTFKIIMSESIPKKSIIRLEQVDLMGALKLVLYKSTDKAMYAKKDTIVGQVTMKKRVINPIDVDSLLKAVDSTKKGLLEF